MSSAKKLDPSTQFYDAVKVMDEITLSQRQFQQFADLMYEVAGVDLPDTPKNHALVRNRLIKIIRKRSLTTYEQYWKLVETRQNPYLQEFVESLTTNMTSFYREPAHFDFLKQILPELVKQKTEVRIWCAAASTGQEPYTISITAQTCLDEMTARKVRILATDIDTQVLKKGSRGVYDEKEMQGLSLDLRGRFFDKQTLDGVHYFRAKSEIHKGITFAPFNLMNAKYEFKNPFQIIICRNVLIYFDEETTKAVIDKLVSTLEIGGYLVLGHSESGNVKHQGLKSLSRAVYQRIK